MENKDVVLIKMITNICLASACGYSLITQEFTQHLYIIFGLGFIVFHIDLLTIKDEQCSLFEVSLILFLLILILFLCSFKAAFAEDHTISFVFVLIVIFLTSEFAYCLKE